MPFTLVDKPLLLVIVALNVNFTYLNDPYDVQISQPVKLFVIILRVFGLVVDIMLNLFLFIVPCFTFVAVSLLPSTDDRR